MTRRLAVLVVAAVALVVLAPTAHAAPAQLPTIGECRTPPVPGDPFLGGALASNVPKTFPRPGDPWDGTGTTSILEQYGTAGTAYETYDTGCIATDAVMPQTMTAVANLMGLFPKWAVSLTASFGNWVLNPGSWLATLDQPIDLVSAELFKSFTQPFMPLLLIVAAIAVVYGARRARLGAAFTTLGVALLGLCLVYLAVIGPSKVTHLFDGLVQTGVSAAMAGTMGPSTDPSVAENPGTRIMAPLWDAVAYDQWLEGELGSATSPTAVAYGPRLFKAHAMTWAEARQAHTSTGAMDAMVASKEADWTAVAEEIHVADPAAYEYLIGHRGWERVGSAATQWVLLIPLLFPVTALGMVLLGYLIFRYVGAFLPVLGALMVVPRWHGVVRMIGSLLAAAVVNTVIFAAGGAAVLSVTNALLKSALPKWLALLIIAGVSLVAWMALKPFRKLTQLVSNPVSGMTDTLDAPGNALGAAKSFLGKAAATAAGLELFKAAGGELGGAGDEGDDGQRPELTEVPQDAPTPQDAPVVVTMPPPAPSTYTQVPMGDPAPDEQWMPDLAPAPAMTAIAPAAAVVAPAATTPMTGADAPEVAQPEPEPVDFTPHLHAVPDADVIQMRPELDPDGQETFAMYEPETGEYVPDGASFDDDLDFAL